MGKHEGEGQLFFSDLHPKVALKRWFTGKKPTRTKRRFQRSLKKLREGGAILDSDPKLGDLVEIVRIYEEGPDWIIRDFDPGTVPYPDVNSERATETLEEAIDILSSNDQENILLNRLLNPNENVHWSAKKGKIVIIDMQ